MITVWGEGRGFRVVWMLEEMGLPYRLRPVDLLKGAESDPEFMAINPGGFIPALEDGETVVVESIAILEYLAGRYGPSPLAPQPQDEAFPAYQQFLHLGEAGLGAPMFFACAATIFGPESARDDWTGNVARHIFESRRRLVKRQLAETPYMAGETFTAADISVTWALEFADRQRGAVLDAAERAYLARTTGRDGYRRAMDSCQATKAWVAGLAAAR